MGVLPESPPPACCCTLSTINCDGRLVGPHLGIQWHPLVDTSGLSWTTSQLAAVVVKILGCGSRGAGGTGAAAITADGGSDRVEKETSTEWKLILTPYIIDMHMEYQLIKFTCFSWTYYLFHHACLCCDSVNRQCVELQRRYTRGIFALHENLCK